jgi:long-subunit acyl-CoA synthetase (AMP-forming)
MVELAMVSDVGQAGAYALVVLAEEPRPRGGDPALRGQVEQAMGGLLRDVNRAMRMPVVASEPWSIENGCLAPTMKIKRSRIEAQANERLAAWYAAQGPVVWA